MKGIKLVTFDATNTFLRFRIPPWEYYSLVGKNYGFNGTVGALKAQMKDGFKVMNVKHPNFGRNDISWENWWKELVRLTFAGQLPASANIELIANKLIDEYTTTKCWEVAGGSQKLLNYLKSSGFTIGVLSNFDPRLIDILKNISLFSKFDFIVTSYDIGFSKPDKEIFENAIKVSKKQVKPSECLHIGDDYVKDYRGAKAAGWHALLVAPNNISKEAQLDKTHIYDSIEALRLALEQNKIKL